MKQSLRYGLLLTACALLSVRCASEALPGGGPPDKEPPVLLMSSVQNGATGVDPRQALRFEFSEPLNAASARKSITIFPVGEKTADIRIRQGRITITPAEVWEADVVYTVILGKNISDLRNNGLTAPVQVSFTTGPVMPQNRINGKVYGLKPNGTAVIAISRRTTVPAEVIKAPEFYTQTSPDGNFSFQYLPADIFTIAGYVDLDKSNSYEPRFDGTCVPRVPALTPDTLSSAPLPMLAVYDNYLEPKLLSAENLYPGATKLEFTKAPAPWNKSGSFRIDAAAIDTVLYHDRGCTLYHDALPGDTLSLGISGLQDHLDCALRDTVVRIPVSALKDSLYTFEQKNDLLFITPPPAKAFLSGSYQTSADTATLTLKRIVHGIYAVPAAPAPVRGNWQIRLAPGPGYPFMAKDTLYI
ncbi:MAG: Ig-like domain-containing protein, partial [Candidatus Marinimicrobia bacterium]|nr:Ig-like domain-containing protein [Candidatus Neomarinimicrobiota bacterium]